MSSARRMNRVESVGGQDKESCGKRKEETASRVRMCHLLFDVLSSSLADFADIIYSVEKKVNGRHVTRHLNTRREAPSNEAPPNTKE